MKIENVTLNEEQRLYVIPAYRGFSCLGFDVAEKWVVAICGEMNRPDLLPKSKPGTLEHFDDYQTALEAARTHNARTGYRFTFDLTPQLVGLEGKRVEVVDCYGETRRFYVGKSTGFIPVHLEIARCNSTGGGAVTGAPFKSVYVVSRKGR
jgi:hypothetical protein